MKNALKTVIVLILLFFLGLILAILEIFSDDEDWKENNNGFKKIYAKRNTKFH